MTAQETAGLVGALIALITALQGWLVYKAQDHSTKINGLMGPRITKGATTAIAADHAARGEMPTPVVVVPADPVKQARVAALQAELAELGAPAAH